MRYDPQDPLPSRPPIVLIVGRPGIGKTTLGYGFHTLLHDFDRGAARAVNPGRPTEVPDTWSDVAFTEQALAPFRGVTIDTVERCITLLSADVIQEAPKFRTSAGELSQQGWGVVKRRFGGKLDDVQRLDKDCLLTAHTKDERHGDQRVVRPDIPGGSRDEVLKRATFVGLLEMRGNRRVLDFSPTDSFIGKNPGEWPALMIPPAEQVGDFMGELFDDARRALARIAAASAAIAREVARWRGEVDALRSPAEFTATFDRLRAIKAAEPLVYQQAHHLFDAARRRQAMRWDGSAFVVGDVTTSQKSENPLRTSRAATWQPRLDSTLTERAS